MHNFSSPLGFKKNLHESRMKMNASFKPQIALHIRQCELEAIKCGTLKIFSTSHVPSIVLNILCLESKFKFLFSLNRFLFIAQLLSLLTFKLSCHLIL
jgi:hypothetical protein